MSPARRDPVAAEPATTRKQEIAAALGAAIRDVRLERRESQVTVARRLGIEQTILSRWELGRILPSLDDIERLDDALRLRPGGLLVRAGLVELAANPTEAAIEADAIISVEGKRALLHFYLVEFKAAAVRATEGHLMDPQLVEALKQSRLLQTYLDADSAPTSKRRARR